MDIHYISLFICKQTIPQEIFSEENDGSKNIFTTFALLLRKTALHTESV